MLQGDTQQSGGVSCDARLATNTAAFWFSFPRGVSGGWVVRSQALAPGSPAKYSVIQAVFTGPSHNCEHKGFQYVSRLILISVISAKIRSNSCEANGVPLI